MTIFASRFGTEALAAQSIVSNVATLCFQVPFAFAVAISTRMGHFIGDGNIASAKILNDLTVIIGGSIGLLSFACSISEDTCWENFSPATKWY